MFEGFIVNPNIKTELHTTLQKMYLDTKDNIKIDKQFDMFYRAQGMLQLDMATATRDRKQPSNIV